MQTLTAAAAICAVMTTAVRRLLHEARRGRARAQLTPDLRSQVEARVTNGQTVRGILETMLLNNQGRQVRMDSFVTQLSQIIF
jgi:hypothetical protein